MVRTRHSYNSVTVLETLMYSCELRLQKQSQPTELSVLKLLTDMGFKNWADRQVKTLAGKYSLSLRFKGAFLYNCGVLCNMEKCIR